MVSVLVMHHIPVLAVLSNYPIRLSQVLVDCSRDTEQTIQDDLRNTYQEEDDYKAALQPMSYWGALIPQT